MWICKKCNSINDNDQSKYCPKCGTVRKEDDMVALSVVRQSRQIWQYKVITVDCGIPVPLGGQQAATQAATQQKIETSLAREGAEGWELVSIVQSSASIRYLMASFKRPF